MYGVSDHCHVWAKKEYVTESWTKVFTAEIQDSYSRVVAFRNNGELLIHNPAELVSYNPCSQVICCLEKLTAGQYHSPHAVSY